MSLAFMFPGQNSRYPGMFEKLIDLHPQNRLVFERASEHLGEDLVELYSKDNNTAFENNRNIQVGTFLANHMFMTILDHNGVKADYSIGLSLGEYNHLVHIGSVSFEDALTLINARGEAYDKGAKGSMAAVYPLCIEDLMEIIMELQCQGTVEIVNINSPTQNVIAGETKAVEDVIAKAEDEYFAQGIVVDKELPMHSSLFGSVADEYRNALETVEFKEPSLAYFPNRLGRIFDEPTRDDYIELLSTHVCKPVLWRKTIDYLTDLDPDVMFLEVGPLSVLHNLISRKWKRNKKFHCDSKENTKEHLETLINELTKRN